MRKLLDQTWKTSTPDSFETRQAEIGTHDTGDRNTRPIQQSIDGDILWKKRVTGCKCKSHSRYFSLSTCCSAWQYHHPLVKFLFRTTCTSLWRESSHDQTSH
ncbi:hypothetical protein BDA96_05G081200 [Sorghum bicolor]|uniref:Uncharacterized protein n=2 Tax=Sorghum bicolor TaxID=4558 RepID=A0A921UEQ6_SORBI|nr:hypothetical protein BDA96_05G081200 [Sorghum bicolor]KXG28059.1 hypothetical protein SORBI_3005G080100 [Sorghum bicolor]